jgi:hypothetical protein
MNEIYFNKLYVKFSFSTGLNFQTFFKYHGDTHNIIQSAYLGYVGTRQKIQVLFVSSFTACA